MAGDLVEEILRKDYDNIVSLTFHPSISCESSLLISYVSLRINGIVTTRVQMTNEERTAATIAADFIMENEEMNERKTLYMMESSGVREKPVEI